MTEAPEPTNPTVRYEREAEAGKRPELEWVAPPTATYGDEGGFTLDVLDVSMRAAQSDAAVKRRLASVATMIQVERRTGHRKPGKAKSRTIGKWSARVAGIKCEPYSGFASALAAQLYAEAQLRQAVAPLFAAEIARYREALEKIVRMDAKLTCAQDAANAFAKIARVALGKEEEQ